MLKKEGVIFLVFAILISGIISAQENTKENFSNTLSDLDACVSDCKTICEDESCKSDCIEKCRVNTEFNPDEDFKYEEDKDDFDDDFSEKENSDDEKLFEGYEDEVLEIDAGTTPESSFYFIDRFFDRFSDDLDVKEERIAEIKAMVEAGNIRGAKKALENYNKLAKKLEQEIGPEKRDAALRSAAAIRNTMKEIQDKIPEEDRQELVQNIRTQEHSIATSAEIAQRIRDLCRELAELDPNAYYNNCKSDDDSPKWQKNLDKKLTQEQIKEAKNFGKIMSECFKSSGQKCRCDEIPFTDFSEACSIAAPLAAACNIKGDERACEKLDSLEMPELPAHLQDVFDELESGMMESKYDMHMPKECVEAGVTNPKDCGRIMIEANAPEECKEALLAAEVQNERQGREICDKIMMQKHAPECIEQGITDPDKCQDYMFNINRRPTECAEHGIHDIRDCKKFLEQEGRGRQTGPQMDFDCKSIQDPMERLNCYDKASSQTKGFKGFDDEDYNGPCMTDSDWKIKKAECRSKFGESAGDEPIMGDSGEGYECPVDIKCIDFSQGKLGFEDIKKREGECADKCESQGGAWDFSYGECKCYFDGFNRGEGSDKTGCDDCASKCPGASGTGCVDNRCECYYEDNSNADGNMVSGDEGSSGGEGEDGSSWEGRGTEGITNGGTEGGIEGGSEGGTEPAPSEPSSGSGGGGGSSSGGGESSSGSSSGGGGGGEESSASPEITGAAITGNAFLDYYYK